MTDSIERTLHRLDGQLPGRVSRPGDNRYIAATALWVKPIGRMPRAVVHCRTPQDVQSAIRAARDCDLPLSVRGGGHDWAGQFRNDLRRLCREVRARSMGLHQNG
jgi:FAD/FMN-containing dehydrogenase